MIVVDDNFVLRTIHMYEKGVNYILWEDLLLLLENGILGKVSFMLELCLTKATWRSRLVGYLPNYPPYVLTSNDMSRY